MTRSQVVDIAAMRAREAAMPDLERRVGRALAAQGAVGVNLDVWNSLNAQEQSIIKGARNLENAKKWYDWALTPEAQKLGLAAKAFQVPSNKNSEVPPQAPKLADIKLIDYDFKKYGSAAERTRLLAKWDAEVKSLPQ